MDAYLVWFDNSFLEVNAQKTQEIYFGRSRVKGASHPLSQSLMIKGQTVETVSTCKYLGTVVDENLTFTDNVHHIYKKTQQRLFLLRSSNVSADVLQFVYTSLIESVLSFNLVSWYGNLSAKNKARLARVVNQACKMVVIKQLELFDLYQQVLRRKAVQIQHGPINSLNSAFETIPSGRPLRMPLARKNCYRRSFVPSAISILNSSA